MFAVITGLPGIICVITDACSQICFVFVCAMGRYLEIDVGRTTGTKEEGGYSAFKNRGNQSHQIKYMEMHLRQSFMFSCRIVTFSRRC